MQGVSWLITNVLPYVAVAVFIFGSLGRALRWQFMPKHFRWTLYPAPPNLAGQATFMAAEIFAFRAMFRANRALWFGAWLFHLAMALSFLWLVLLLLGVYVDWLAIIGFGLLGISSLYMLAYRLFVPTARAITTPVEFFNLGLFLLIAILCAAIWLVEHPEISAVRLYLFSLCSFNPEVAVPTSLFVPLLLVVEIFLIYFPFSRMIHMVSKYFAFHKIQWEH